MSTFPETNLTPVTFEVYAVEDIKAADGVSEDYFKKDDLIGTITTDDTGIAKLGDLPVGKYCVVEKETAYGYVLDNAPRFVDLSYRDQDTPIVVYDEKWQNARQKVSVSLVKKEKGTEAPLKGAVFGLYAAEDIKSKEGKVLLEKDTLIEQRRTDADGLIAFTADLPIDAKYYLQEIEAPNGYVNAREKQEFTFTYEGSDKDLLKSTGIRKPLAGMVRGCFPFPINWNCQFFIFRLSMMMSWQQSPSDKSEYLMNSTCFSRLL